MDRLAGGGIACYTPRMPAAREDDVYLDWAATAPLSSEAREAMLPWLGGRFGNASSLHARGKRARLAVQAARESLAGLLGTSPAAIVFTSGATEADNLALRGGAWAMREEAGRRHVLVSAIEHAAVLRASDALAREGFDVEHIPVGADGVVDAARVATQVRADTAVVSLMAVSNEIGTLQPVTEVAALARAAGALVHCDAVQAAGWQAIDAERWGVDLLCISAHKMGGPQGAGALFVRPGLSLVPQIVGGEQENQRRAGTENVAAIVGFGAAAAAVCSGRKARFEALRHVERRLMEGLFERVPHVQRVGAEGALAPHIACVHFGGVHAETLLYALDMNGVAVSSGAACASRSLEPAPALLAMGLSPSEASSTLRFSWGSATTDNEIDRVLEVLPRLVEQNRATQSRAGGRTV